MSKMKAALSSAVILLAALTVAPSLSEARKGGGGFSGGGFHGGGMKPHVGPSFQGGKTGKGHSFQPGFTPSHKPAYKPGGGYGKPNWKPSHKPHYKPHYKPKYRYLYYGLPYYYYGPYYYYSQPSSECAWLYRKAKATGKACWWRRYEECMGY